MFTDSGLKKMILPLFGEQFLVMLVGIADTLAVSYAGEAAVSGVSLVNQFNTVFIYLFTALASGGAVVISQYLGRKEDEYAGETASQLFLFSAGFSVAAAAMVLFGNEAMLRLLFGNVDQSVMDACVTYLRISAYSYPAIAVYNAGAAVFRSLGRTDVTMYLSVVSNGINIVGNIIGVFILHAGVAGVAWPSFFARVFLALAMTAFCFEKNIRAAYKKKWIFSWNGSLMKSILKIAVPNGIENGIFQFVKVALSSMVALFGTRQIAANGVAQSIWSLAALAGVSMGPVFITVIGQCMGKHDTEAAEYYFRKLAKLTVLGSAGWNFLILILTPLFLRFYSLDSNTRQLVILLVLIHNVFNAVAYPFSGALSNGLRAAGDVKFTMYISVFSTIAVRLLFSWLLGIVLNMGVVGIAYAMAGDWVFRAAVFAVRFQKGSWKRFQVIETEKMTK